MLTGMLLIAKFLIVKILMDPVRFKLTDKVSENQYDNLKMLATTIYFAGFREFVQKSVSIKNKDFNSDSDGGITNILFDDFRVTENALGS